MVIKDRILKIHLASIEKSRLLKNKVSLVHTLLIVLILAMVILIAAIGFLIYIRNYPPSYVVMKNQADGTPYISRVVRLEYPKISNESLMRWSSRAVTDIFNFNFDLESFNQHFIKIQKHFTQDGYLQFREMMKASGILDNVLNERLIISAVSCEKATIQDTKTLAGNQGNHILWNIGIPVIFRIQSASETKKLRYIIQATLETGTKFEDDKSIAIAGIAMHSPSYNSEFCRLPR